MKISTEISNAASFIGVAKTIELIAKAGFDAWDFSLFDIACPDHPLMGNNYLDIVRLYKKIGEDNGIVCNQSHAPFLPFLKVNEKFMIRALKCTAAAGGDVCIVHPDSNKTTEENAEYYLNLLPVAKDLGIKIAAENLYLWNDEKMHAVSAACSNHNDYMKLLKAVGDDNFVACLDVGHAEMKGLETSAVTMIKTLQGYIKALHIHDNDKWRDCHQLPYTMEIDFSPVIEALCKTGYSGYLTLECKRYIACVDEVEEKLRRMATVARKMACEFDAVSG